MLDTTIVKDCEQLITALSGLFVASGGTVKARLSEYLSPDVPFPSSARFHHFLHHCATNFGTGNAKG